ncbi:hypothetical protein [Streptomyces sp. HUAS TT7]|uniref:hypothetical protein n=1 Tax=Streptomyces sp. HUAS TT7 TaxID=3447507 RepID=UPI003F65ED17
MYKFTGPAARAAIVAGLVSVLSTGYAAYAAGNPVPASPHSACSPHSEAAEGQGDSSGNEPEAAPQHHYAHEAIAEKLGEQHPAGGTEEHGSGPQTPWSPAATPPKQTPTLTPTPTVEATWGEQTPPQATWGEQTPPASTPPASTPPASTPPTGTPTGSPTSPPGTWTPTSTPTYPTPTPPEKTTPGTPGTSPSAPPHLAHTGAGSKASLLGALSAGAIVTGAAAVALTRRASRSKCEK